MHYTYDLNTILAKMFLLTKLRQFSERMMFTRGLGTRTNHRPSYKRTGERSTRCQIRHSPAQANATTRSTWRSC